MMIEAKVCENCNHKNPVTAVECEKCGYDLTFVYPQRIDDTSGEENSQNDNTATSQVASQCGGWVLANLTNSDEEEIISGETSVGRDCELFNMRFNSSNFTSRIHAKIRVFEDRLQIMDASTNGTFVGERRIPKMEWTDVADGETVKFADISFVVRRK